SSLGAGTLTWNYSEFDKDSVDVTTSGGPVTVRVFLGSYAEDI
ncbi:unnamed protein product, partial [marine sediment metagenome]